MSTLSKDECVYMAKLAEQAERYDEMADYMKDVDIFNLGFTVSVTIILHESNNRHDRVQLKSPFSGLEG